MKAEDYYCMGCMEKREKGATCPLCCYKHSTAPESPLYLPIGTTLKGKYLIGRVLGHGGFGITYIAFDLELQVKLAIKEYLPRDIATRSTNDMTVRPYTGPSKEHFSYGLNQFLEEARKLAQFEDSPGIVSIRDFFRANGTAYFVMHFVEGITFKEYLERNGGIIPFDQAVKILMPVMDALREVHGAKLLHRDISPDNIYITRDNRIKLMDFGAARYATGEHSRSLSVMLKPGYAPEEQYRSKGKQGAWTDVYALAATLYRAVTGQVPLQATDRLYEDTVLAPSKLGVSIPPEKEAALMKALSVRAEERFQSVEDFQQALMEEPPPLPSPGPTPLEPTKDDWRKIENKVGKNKDLNVRNSIYCGICLYVISFFLEALNNDDTELRGYYAAWMVLYWLFEEFSFFSIYLNLANFAMLATIVIQFFKPSKWFVLIPILGFSSAVFWFYIPGSSGALKIGYWMWLISQTIVYISFGIKLFPKPSPSFKAKTVRWKIGAWISLSVVFLVLIFGEYVSIPKSGHLYVDTTPSGARIRILNSDSEFAQGMRLKPGTYKVEVSYTGYKTQAKKVRIDAGEDERVSFKLSKIPAHGDHYTNSLGMEFVYIGPGSFMMGSPEDEEGRYDKEAQHKVTLTQGYWLQTTEVTVAQFRKFVNATGYKTDAEKDAGGKEGSYVLAEGEDGKRTWGYRAGYNWRNPGFDQTDDMPVCCVSWNDAQEYITWLNKQTGITYALPTEAQWEYAARGGTSTARFWGEDSEDACNYANAADLTKDGTWKWNNSHSCTDGYYWASPVGSFQPNGYGLYDMIGNVWEWCEDWHGDYPTGLVTDPMGPSTGTSRVLRGGSWSSIARYCRSANRGWNRPDIRFVYFGFRLAVPPGR